jgi:hypothetical protein
MPQSLLNNAQVQNMGPGLVLRLASPHVGVESRRKLVRFGLGDSYT